MLFSFAIRILICKETCIIYNEQALKFFRKFVVDFSSLYGEYLVNYNIHSLIHLPRFVSIHGPLDNFSCFRYENYLHELKKSIKCSKHPLQEAFNRIKEKQKNIDNNLWPIHNIFTLKNEFINNVHSPFFDLSANLYKQIVLNKLNITIDVTKEKDKFLMLKNNNFIIVQQIVQVLNQEPFFIVKQILEF